MKIGPSSEVHCDPCLFSRVHEQDISRQMQLLEVHAVNLFAGRLAAKQELNLHPPEKLSPIVYQRHQAEVVCASTILRGDCPLFVYGADAGGHKTVRNRPPDLEGFGGLKSI